MTSSPAHDMTGTAARLEAVASQGMRCCLCQGCQSEAPRVRCTRGGSSR